MLPAAMWGEKEGTYTNSERRVSKVNRAVPPPGEARSDFDIFLELAGALGVRDEIFPGWTKPADAFEEWRRVSAGRLCDYSGMTYKAIEQHGGVQWPFPAGAANAGETRRLYADGRLPDRGWPGATDSRAVGAISRAAERRVPVRAEHRPDGRALAHANQDGEGADPREAVAERLGGDEPARRAWAQAQAAGSRGHRVAARPRARRRAAGDRDGRTRTNLRPVPLRRGQRQQVTQSAFDPFSREPNYKQSAVRVERAPAGIGSGSETRDHVELANPAIPNPESRRGGVR